MENNNIEDPNLPVIKKRQANGKSYVYWQGKEYGPWDELDDVEDEGKRRCWTKIQFSPDRVHWAIRGRLNEKHYLLIDGRKYGPFNFNIKGPMYDPSRGAFVFAAQRDNEFFLIANGKIIKKGKVIQEGYEEEFIVVNNKRFGPYQDIELPLFSLSGKKWAAAVWREKQSFLLLNGKEHGPFRHVSRVEFSRGAEICTCSCSNEQGEGLLVNGEKFYSPNKGHSGPWFSPDGKRWGLDIQKGKKWYGFVVDGIEYGPFPYQFFVPQFSPDSRHWAVILNSGYEDRPHSFILDGVKHGPFKLLEFGFMADNLFIALFQKGNARYIFLDGRTIGPFRHKNKKLIHLENAVLSDLVFIKKGKKNVCRCVLNIGAENSEKRILFSSKTGETMKDAIEIINAVDTDEGVYAEYAYLRLKSQSLGIVYTMVEQQHIPDGDKHYDKLTIALEDGKEESYFFDITSFYGKFSPEIERLLKKGNR